MARTVKILNRPVQIDATNDYYGEGFWDKITRNQWEPDTLSFIETYCNSETHFMDIGAANGAMTFAAALCGSTTTSYEPDPIIFKSLKQNVLLNLDLAKFITLDHSALSDTAGKLVFNPESDPEVLSNILFRERTFEPFEVEVKSIVEELNRLALTGKKIVIKIDIEGAEFKILRNPEVLKALKFHKALMLLAIHPGFNRTYRKSRIHRKYSEKRWQYSNIRENKELFQRISTCAQIRRTNLNLVTSLKQFLSLADAGYHEFILDFDSGYFL